MFNKKVKGRRKPNHLTTSAESYAYLGNYWGLIDRLTETTGNILYNYKSKRGATMKTVFSVKTFTVVRPTTNFRILK